MLSQEEKKNQDWETWRKETTESLKQIRESLSSRRAAENAPESLPFDGFMTGHVASCPECQKVLEKHGYTKKVEEKKEPSEILEKEGSEKKPKRWMPGDV